MQGTTELAKQIGVTGLYGRDVANKKNHYDDEQIELPLKNISFLVQIYQGIAEVNQTQTYFNDTGKFLEVQFKFPINPSACLHRLTAAFSGIHLFGVVKEKRQAQIEYVTAIKEGKRAAYGEIRQQSKDVMVLRIGNIDPGTQVKIEISHIEQLKTTLETFYTFDLQTKLFPRYFNKLPKEDFVNSYQNQANIISGCLSWDFLMKVKSTRKIICCNSPTRNLKLCNSNSESTELSFILDVEGLMKQRDISFIYSTENFQLPSFVVGNTDQSTTVMVSFVPKFCQLSIGDAEKAAMEDRAIDIDFQQIKSEYLFLLDRSGSMGGEKIQSAKNSLIIFLKSLPIDSYFNVISFGSSYQKMFEASQKINKDTMSTAINQIDKMSANMGGTQIQASLKEIMSKPVIQNYSRQIFLLTDGQVNNTQSVIDLVRKNAKFNRVHTIGFGSGASRNLIEGCAKSGRGHHVFVQDSEDPAEKIIQMLTDSFTKPIEKFNLKFDKQLVKSISPNPSSISCILKGEVNNFYVTFNGRLTQQTKIQFQYQDPISNMPLSSSVVIDPLTQSFSCIDKMGHSKVIAQLENSTDKLQDRIYFVKPVDRRKQIVNLSMKHQILSTLTSFICVEKHLVDGRFQEIQNTGKIQVLIEENEQDDQICDSANQFFLPSTESACLPTKQCYVRSSSQVASRSQRVNRQQECFRISKVTQQQSFKRPVDTSAIMNKLVKELENEGFWTNPSLLKEIFQEAEISNLPSSASHVAITVLILRWIKQNIVSKEYSIIVRKAVSWLKKQASLPEIAQRYGYVAQ